MAECSVVQIYSSVKQQQNDIVSTTSNLGAIFDDALAMTGHITSVCLTSFIQLRQLRAVCSSVADA